MNFFHSLQRVPWPQQLTTVAAFLVPGLALCLPSGYSYGAVLLLVGALLTARRWPLQRQDRLTRWFAVSLLAMACLWVALADPQEHWGKWDRPAKFVLGCMCLLFATTYCPTDARALFWGLLLGCLGAGAVALWQIEVEGALRASGFPTQRTNAIQWGNLALLMATMLAVQTLCLRAWLRPRIQLLAAVAVLAALNASVLSQSRGGWLALVLALPLGLFLLYRINRQALWKVVAGVFVAITFVTVLNLQVFTQRWGAMEQEVQKYERQGESSTSVGQRLEHWRLAWDMGRERPIFGWGMGGYMAEKSARVAAGLYQPSVVEYKYVHNEMLDLFVKTGLVGVLVVLFFYAVPILMFWPSRSRMARYSTQPMVVSQVLALRLSGLCIPVLYMGFGLTQVFFAHNNGIMLYIFMVVLTWATLLGVERDLARSVPPLPAQP